MLGRTQPTWFAVMAISIMAMLGCSPTDRRISVSAKEITESQGLEISRKAATSAGYDLGRYKLDAFGDRTGDSDREWLFVYLCSPGPPPPGCSFMVVVDRETGASTVHPGM
jgi:hypothetical protein